MEVQVRPLVIVTPRFIQPMVPLPSLNPMVQSRRGGTHILEAKKYLLAKDIRCVFTSRIWITPRPDETTIFKGSKGIFI
jgi:hypothetical protein